MVLCPVPTGGIGERRRLMHGAVSASSVLGATVHRDGEKAAPGEHRAVVRVAGIPVYR